MLRKAEACCLPPPRDLTCPLKKSLGGHFDPHNGRSYWPILLIFNSKHWKTTLYLVLNFEENRSKIATVRVPEWKTYKMAAMTSSILNFQNRWKMSLANILKIICGKFHQNRPIRMGCRDDTHTQTHTQTDRHTDTQTHRHPRFDPNIFSQNLTEYKNDVRYTYDYDMKNTIIGSDFWCSCS